MKSPLSQSDTNARPVILVKTEDDIDEDTHENLEAIRASLRPSIVARQGKLFLVPDVLIISSKPWHRLEHIVKNVNVYED